MRPIGVLNRSAIGLAVAGAVWSLACPALAIPVDFISIESAAHGPPYPSNPLVTQAVIHKGSAAQQSVDQNSIWIEGYSPPAAGDYFVANEFSFAVEREMKESSEKGGTEDINIGVGELQECTLGFQSDTPAATVQNIQTDLSDSDLLCLMYEVVTSTGTVTYTSYYSTPQPATFSDAVVNPDPAGGPSFTLTMALLFSDDYDPELSIFTETATADYVPIPEPAVAPVLIALCAYTRRRR